MGLSNEDRRFDAIQEFLNLNSAQQLDPVLDSLQTLRRLAKDISAAEIAETDKKAKQLLKDLASIQNELKSFNEIKRCLAEVKNYNRKDLRRKSSKPQSGNIIPFPSPLKADEPVVSSDNTVDVPETSSFISHTQSDRSFHLPEADEPGQPKNLLPAEEKPETLEAKPPLEDLKVVDSTHVTAAHPLPHMQKIESVIEPPLPSNRTSIVSTDDSLSQDTALPDGEPALQAQTVASTVASAPAEASELTEKPQQQAVPKRSQKDGEFDQGLLKELIKDYGEFDSYSSLSPAGAPADKSVSAPAALRNAPPPEVDHPPARTADFDQEVRELIKTYGKVDIYSTQAEDRKRIVKRSVMAAVALGVVLSGSYFFVFRDTPQQVDPPAESRPVSSQSDAIPSMPGGDEKNASTAKKSSESTATEVSNRR